MEQLEIISIINKIAQWGKVERGTSRLAFTESDWQAKEYFIGLMKESGLAVRVDAFGNIIGRMEGSEEGLPAVAFGSHLDTVPEGGNFDGVVGVVAGLAAIKQLQKRETLRHPLELIIFAAEESSRFGFSVMGSKVMTGASDKHAWRKAKDKDGVLLSEALKAQGFDLEAIGSAVRTKDEFKAFVELHIEQGPVLEKDGLTIGIVEAIAAPIRIKITVEGLASHSGTTPMNQRQDALVSAAMIVLAVRDVAKEYSERSIVGTVGVLRVNPGAMNVIPGLVEMWVDLRGTDYETIIEAMQEIKDSISDIAEEQETPVSIDVMASDRPVVMSDDIKNIIEEVCKEKNMMYRRMPSGAGHDAMNMAKITPTGMIFIPCREGISHNGAEYAAAEDIVAGVDVLSEVIYKLAK